MNTLEIIKNNHRWENLAISRLEKVEKNVRETISTYAGGRFIIKNLYNGRRFTLLEKMPNGTRKYHHALMSQPQPNLAMLRYIGRTIEAENL